MAPVAPAAPAVDPVIAKVLAVVAEKTGYPQDMLDLDLDLEADLGIDTVKQAETFAAIREAFDIPLQEGLNLRDYPTLASVIGFVRTNAAGPGMRWRRFRPRLPPLPPSVRHRPRVTPARRLRPAADPVVDKVLAVVAEKTGYPQDMLDLDLDLEADLGIDTVKQAETFAAIREAFDIPVQEGLNLRDYPDAGQRHRLRPHECGRTSAQCRRRLPRRAPSPAPVVHAPAAAPSVPRSCRRRPRDPVVAKVLAVVAEKTGYPTGHARSRPRPGSRPGHRHGQAGRDLRRHPRGLRHPAPGRAEAARLPDAEQRRSASCYTMRPDLARRYRAAGCTSAAARPHLSLPRFRCRCRRTPAGDPVTAKVLEIVAEKTGYPQDMLELDLDLEADLGVDTVKQAETFAAVREAFDIPVQEGLKLRDYPTLKSVDRTSSTPCGRTWRAVTGKVRPSQVWLAQCSAATSRRYDLRHLRPCRQDHRHAGRCRQDAAPRARAQLCARRSTCASPPA